MLRGLCLAWGIVWAGFAMAQQTQPGGALQQGVVQSPVVVVEFDRLFAESAFGKRMTDELEARGAEIAAENREIEAALTDEERTLTEQRAAMTSEEFRALADAFDEKVQRLRAEQDAKARALGGQSDEARRRFLTLAQPVLQNLMREAGAAVMLERRNVFLAVDAVDLTDLAITRLDAIAGTQTDEP